MACRALFCLQQRRQAGYNVCMKTRTLAVLLALFLAGCNAFGQAEPPPVANAPTPTIGLVPSPTTAIRLDGTPIPISAPTPVPSPTAPTAPPKPAAPAPASDEIAALDAAVRPQRDQVALARALGACRPDPASCPTVARTEPLDVQVGELREFFVTNFSDNSQFPIRAELRYAGPVVLMYVEEGMAYSQADLEFAARAFEEEIYPRTREIFGSEIQPGVDGDLRITILNAREPSGQVLGYYSSQDSVPAQINRFSNEREMFFMNIEALSFSDEAYLDVLAHEFQHMIHQNEQPNSAIWFNEGASQLSEDLNGFFGPGFTLSYLYEPDIQLNTWAVGPGQAAAHYGAAHLFLRYIYAQYSGEEQLRPLIRADAGDNLGAFVELAAQRRPDINSFGQIVADWAVANLIDDPRVGDGRYTYATGHELPDLLPERVTPVPLTGQERRTVAQFGANYLELPAGAWISFQGATTVGLAAESPRDAFAWWSGRSDDTLATLTRAFDLRGLTRATLEFETWYEIENDYDYAFVSVSTDGGQTWETLAGSLTTTDDPQGFNYGNGITGVSGEPGGRVEDGARGRWATERMDLTPYAGQEILLRFWQITDQGFNAPGMLIDNISILELGFRDDVEAGAGDWQAEGFVRVDGDLPQRWELRLVRTSADGVTIVEPIPVRADGASGFQLEPGERGVLVVLGATPHTTERAAYEIGVR